MKNRKIFQIAAEFDLNKKPDWLDSFRLKYDQPYSYHITLKTSTYFDRNGFRNLKDELSDMARKYTQFKVIFNKLFISSSSGGGCIMIKAKNNNILLKLQNEIAEKFSKYGEHIAKEYKIFENNFKPHITIARHLAQEQLRSAKGELKKDLFCEALVKELVLTTVKNDLFEEWSDPENRFRCKLNLTAHCAEKGQVCGRQASTLDA